MKLEKILEFYIIYAPYTEGNVKPSAKSINLVKAGWDSRSIVKLLRGISDFECFFVSDKKKFKEVLRKKEIKANEYKEGMHIAILMQKNNTDHNTKEETEATCFFRHIRNGFAHGNFEVKSENIWIIDRSEGINGEYTAFIQIEIQYLYKIINAISNYKKDLLENTGYLNVI